MKQWILSLLLLLLGCSGAYAQTNSDKDFQALSPEDQEMLSNAVELVDAGMAEAALPDFEYLTKKYPKNFLVTYENLYVLSVLGRYDQVVKSGKKLLKHKQANDMTFQMIGNAYDMIGDPKQAIKTYEEGLKRYPNSGILYLEVGNVFLMHDQPETAIKYYNRGIVVQPNFASNYYRGAQFYLGTEEDKVWGMIYAETEILLAPSNKIRHKEMAAGIVECLRNNIETSIEGEKKIVSVTFAKTRGMTVYGKMQVRLELPGIYEGAAMFPVSQMLSDSILFTGTLPQLIDVRKGVLEAYFSLDESGLYGNSMYLFDFQKKVIDAGHWEAYNYYLFKPVFEAEFDEWLENNEEAFDAFVDWYNEAPFRLGDGRSVNPLQIYDSYQPMDFLKALQIQAKLATGSDIEIPEQEEEQEEK